MHSAVFRPRCYHQPCAAEPKERSAGTKPEDTEHTQGIAPGVALSAGSNLWNQGVAPEDMVRDAARQVREMHGLRSTPEPYAAAFCDWSDDPFGGGAHLWNVGCASWDLAPKIIQPRNDVPVYIVGEAYSDRQGWVEGALRTSEMLLQQHFGLPPPSWLG